MCPRSDHSIGHSGVSLGMHTYPVTLSEYDARALQASRKSVLHMPVEHWRHWRARPSDLLWVREAAYCSANGAVLEYAARASRAPTPDTPGIRIRCVPAGKLPRSASRFTLQIQTISQISLDQITEVEARQAGVWHDGRRYRGGRHPVRGTLNRHRTALEAFRDEWSSTYMDTDYSLHRDPPILRIRFMPIAQNVDHYLADMALTMSPSWEPG